MAGLTDISDCRTLEMVFTAARQCLVIGLCGFWDNLQAVEWIRSCGVSPASQTGFLRGLLVQRVLPRVCSHCREKIDVPPEMVVGVRDKDTEDLVFYSGQGCRRCGNTGRSGRLGIFELLSFRYHLKDLLARGAEQQIIYEEAQRQGMWTLQEDGITKASQGLIDVRDVLEVAREEGEEVPVEAIRIIRTKRGTIKPRGKNQQAYLRSIKHSDICFGIGPAGTGKTYLAVACAVEALMEEQVRRILLVRPKTGKETLWALEQALQSGVCSAVLAWPGKLSVPVLRRLQLAAESSRTLAVLFQDSRTAVNSSPAALRLQVTPAPNGLAVHILKRRGGWPTGGA